jgi:KipI family sensor histidine kinase inhibitor
MRSRTTIAEPLRWRRFGDVGVLIEFDDGAIAGQWCRAISASGIDAQARPGWRSVLVTSPLSAGVLIDALSELVIDDASTLISKEIDIAVTYDGDDLDDVASAVAMSREEVIRRHVAATYTVVCLGFSRAFPYLSGLDPALWLPRRDSPRTRVPAGSVAIAVEQTGIYPQASPGGWHLLGHTNATLFDVDHDPPSALQPGDRVRFVATSG